MEHESTGDHRAVRLLSECADLLDAAASEIAAGRATIDAAEERLASPSLHRGRLGVFPSYRRAG